MSGGMKKWQQYKTKTDRQYYFFILSLYDLHFQRSAILTQTDQTCKIK